MIDVHQQTVCEITQDSIEFAVANGVVQLIAMNDQEPASASSDVFNRSFNVHIT